MTRTLAPIQRRKLADEVRDRLLDLIRADRLAPGDALPSERTLMQRFEVGRPAVREAHDLFEPQDHVGHPLLVGGASLRRGAPAGRGGGTLRAAAGASHDDEQQGRQRRPWHRRWWRRGDLNP